MGRTNILHLDLDAFYASVEELDHPELRGRAIVVGGHRERGVVCACSYATRSFGVRSGMPIRQALQLCPEIRVLPVRMARYREVSRQVFRIFYTYTNLVEPLSIDEAFLDVSGSVSLFGDSVSIARQIKKDVSMNIGLTLSAGVASNKLLAKMAGDFGKPDGLFVLSEEKVDDFLIPLPVSRLWGVGRKTQARLMELGVGTVGELRDLEIGTLIRLFGKHAGTRLHAMSQGKDESRVEPFRESKSIGREKTFAADRLDFFRLEREILELADDVASRLRAKRCRGRVVTLKIKYADFSSISRRRTLAQASSHGPYIYGVARELFNNLDHGGKAVRLLGLSVGLFENTEKKQLALFAEDAWDRGADLDESIDRIRSRYGPNSIFAASMLETEDKTQKD